MVSPLIALPLPVADRAAGWLHVEERCYAPCQDEGCAELLIPRGQRIVCRDHATLRQWRTTQRDASAPAFASADQSPVICLSTFLAITPLGARIDDLEKEGTFLRSSTSTGIMCTGLCRHWRRSGSLHEFQGLLYQRPWPYQPPPNSRRRTTMMRTVVVSMSGSYSGAISAPHDVPELQPPAFTFRSIGSQPRLSVSQ